MKKKSKGGWNYRVVRTADPKLKGLPQTYSHSIRDVYYDDKTGKPHSWGAEPQYPTGESCNDLFNDYHAMFLAFSRKVLRVENDKLIEGGIFSSSHYQY